MQARRRIALSLAALSSAVVALTATSPAHADKAPSKGSGGMRLNQIQVIGTHNSYHRELSDAEKAVQAKQSPSWASLAYSHASLPLQFSGQRVRGLELDIVPDPDGGLYTAPIVRREAGLGPNEDPELKKPGFKVLHVPDHDYGTSCSSLRTCLSQALAWSNANPGHVPIPVMLEFKSTNRALEQAGGARSPRWDASLMDALDVEIRSVLGDRKIVTPDDVRRPGLTLEQSVLKHGWPTLEQSRGKFLFLMDNDTADIQTPYLTGHPNLEGRTIFTNAVPGRQDAAFIKMNNPTGAEQARIKDAVRRGYFVRTRSDDTLVEARTGDTSRLKAALDSGAQLVSTDFPAVGMAARYGSDYVAQLPGTEPARCNPVIAPRNCHPGNLER